MSKKKPPIPIPVFDDAPPLPKLSEDAYHQQREEAQERLPSLIRRLASLPERPMRREIFAEIFFALEIGTQIELLHLLTLRGATSTLYNTALLAFHDLSYASQPLSYSHRTALYKEAERRQYKHIQRFFLSSAETAESAHLRGHHHLASLTLGERKSLARKPHIHILEKLLFDPEPSVIRMLLQNPRVTERHILDIATRRPNHHAILQEIAQHPRWFQRQSIQIALCKNPYTPHAIVLQYLSSLPTAELQEIQEMGQAHPTALDAVREILHLRDAARFYNNERQHHPTEPTHPPPEKQPHPTPATENNPTPPQLHTDAILQALQRLRKK